MKRIIGLFCASLLLAATAGAANQPENAESAVRQVLGKQAQAWNRHDLDAFMQGYWHSPRLTFFSGATVHRGWEAALQRYRKAYQSEGREMGKLEFSDLQIESLGPSAAFVRGAFRLSMPDGKQPHGMFTLLFRKFPQGWRIVHDHTCAAE